MRVLANGGYYLAGYWLTLPRGITIALRRARQLCCQRTGIRLSGWAVVRFHRDHGPAAAMPFLVIVTLWRSFH
jgi:hypothetical protein